MSEDLEIQRMFLYDKLIKANEASKKTVEEKNKEIITKEFYKNCLDKKLFK